MRNVAPVAIALPADARFDVVIAPFRVIQHLVEIPKQLAFLRQVREHLAPGGRLVFDVFNPKYPAMLTDRSAEQEDTPEVALPDGRFMRRAVRVTAVHWQAQVSEIEMIYYVRVAGKPPDRIVQRFPMRWYTRFDKPARVAVLGRARAASVPIWQPHTSPGSIDHPLTLARSMNELAAC